VSVQRIQSSIRPGQTASYNVQISTQNGPAYHVSVTLNAQPSSQQPTFTSGCTTDDGTALCSIGSLTAEQPASLQAQIPVASTATSVTSVKLTVTASVVTTAKWTPPAAAETTAVTAASTPANNAKNTKNVKNTKKAKNAKDTKNAKKAKNSAQASPNADAAPLAVLPLGPIPALNGQASTLIGAGNASSLFPAITPSPGASVSTSPGPTASTAPSTSKRNAAPFPDASPVSLGTPIFTAQAVGLIALGVAILLTVTRLSVRRRSGKPRG
jgi:hypothetical protein